MGQFGASSSPSPSLLEEGALTRARRGASDCVHPSSSMSWVLLCRCRRGWQGGRVMIPPAHLCPQLGTLCFSLGTCLSQEPLSPPRSQQPLLWPVVRCSHVLGYVLSQDESLLVTR